MKSKDKIRERIEQYKEREQKYNENYGPKIRLLEWVLDDDS